MSDSKDDVITSADDQPETLIDDQLEDVDGGYGYKLTNAHVTSYSFGGSSSQTVDVGSLAETIYAGQAVGDFSSTQIFGGDAILRKRPGR